jgi:hypothetical protein
MDIYIPEVEAGIASVMEKVLELDLNFQSSPTKSIEAIIRLAYADGWENGYESNHG